MIKHPLISVVMSCYNSQSTIKDAVDSILSQTVEDFELIIIDDASTDDTLKILREYEDERIILVCNDTNRGLGYNLNYGVKIAKGDYIARMDSDDISLPYRFECQVKYLREHPDVICLGSRAKKIGKLSMFNRLFRSTILQVQSYDDIKIQMLNGTPMLHPSVMFNGILLRESGLNYDPAFKRAQDYELWSRMVFDYKMENLKDILLLYRYSSTQASNQYRKEQIVNSEVMYRRVLHKLLGREVSDEELNMHILFSTKLNCDKDELEKVSKWVEILHEATISSLIFSEKSFNKFMSVRWAAICRCSLKRTMRIQKYLSKYYFRPYSVQNFLRLIK